MVTMDGSRRVDSQNENLERDKIFPFFGKYFVCAIFRQFQTAEKGAGSRCTVCIHIY